MTSQDEKNKTFEQVAKELGISVELLIQVAIKDELINIDGSPTQKGIDEGYFTEEIQGPTTMKGINLN